MSADIREKFKTAMNACVKSAGAHLDDAIESLRLAGSSATTAQKMALRDLLERARGTRKNFEAMPVDAAAIPSIASGQFADRGEMRMEVSANLEGAPTQDNNFASGGIPTGSGTLGGQAQPDPSPLPPEMPGGGPVVDGISKGTSDDEFVSVH